MLKLGMGIEPYALNEMRYKLSRLLEPRLFFS
jgi:hypothetical protein